jgi:hypothetical protein
MTKNIRYGFFDAKIIKKISRPIKINSTLYVLLYINREEHTVGNHSVLVQHSRSETDAYRMVGNGEAHSEKDVGAGLLMQSDS